jgi:hypothetical protein
MARKKKRSCTNKRRYRFEHEARIAVTELAKKNPEKSALYRYYFCGWCHGFHVTTSKWRGF